MGIILLDELDRLGSGNEGQPDFKVALILTYTLNLHFFEQLVLPKLDRMGISHIGILADRQDRKSVV